MRGKKAKLIRKRIYGDLSQRSRKYTEFRGFRENLGLRAAYQAVKKGFKGGLSEDH